MEFKKNGKFYECTIHVEKNFNLHIEKGKRSGLFFYARTSEEGEFALEHCFSTDEVFDKDFAFRVYPKTFLLKSAVRIDKAYLTFGGEGGGRPTDAPYYVGCMEATKAEFAALTDEEILSNVKEYDRTPMEYECTKDFFILLVPRGKKVDCSYTSNGLVTEIEAEDWNMIHDDIVISEKTYVVYGYRFSGVTEYDPLTYNINIE